MGDLETRTIGGGSGVLERGLRSVLRRREGPGSALWCLLAFAVSLAGCMSQAQSGALMAARSCLLRKDYEATVKELDFAERCCDPTPTKMAEMTFLRAVCYEKMNREPDAIGLHKFVMERFPDSPFAAMSKERLARLPDAAQTGDLSATTR